MIKASNKPTNKTSGLYISFKIQQLALASVIGQRPPNFTIANYSASADCENCSFGHSLKVSTSDFDDSDWAYVSGKTAPLFFTHVLIVLTSNLNSSANFDGEIKSSVTFLTISCLVASEMAFGFVFFRGVSMTSSPTVVLEEDGMGWASSFSLALLYS